VRPLGPKQHGSDRRRIAIAVLTLAALVAAGTWGLFALAGPGARAVATFPGGRVTVAELKAELDALPPSLRSSRPGFLGELASALAYRRALAAAARRAGLSSRARAARAERELVRALLAQEGIDAPTGPGGARDHWKRFWKVLERALGAKVHVEVAQLSRIPVGEARPIPAPEGAAGPAEVEPFWLEDPSIDGASCSGEIHGDRLWYTMECGDSKGPDALSPYHVLYLESTYGPLEGFLHGYVDDSWRSGIMLLRNNATTLTVRPGTVPGEFRARYKATLADVSATGSVDLEQARRHFDRAAGAVEHCLCEHHWNIGYPEREGTVVIGLELAPGAWPEGTVLRRGLTAPVDEHYRLMNRTAASLDRLFPETSCLHPLMVFELSGAGQVTYTIQVQAQAR